MSVNYGAQASRVPGNAGGAAFSPRQPDPALASRGTSGGILWHGGTIAPNIDLHHASVGVSPQHVNDATLASRAPTNPTPGPLVSQNSTFSQLPTAIQDAMRNLGNYTNLGGGVRDQMRNNILNPAMNDYLSQATVRLQQQNKSFEDNQKAQADAAWKAQQAADLASRPQYGMPANLPTAPSLNIPGSPVRQAPPMALPTY